jgi:hypothetical protein
MWRDEEHMHLLAKGFLLIKDDKLEPAAYSDFISVLVALEDLSTTANTLLPLFFH